MAPGGAVAEAIEVKARSFLSQILALQTCRGNTERMENLFIQGTFDK